MKKIGIRFCAWMCAAVLLIGAASASAHANPFTDVSQKNYFYDAVLWAVGQGITNGTTATTFSPQNPCSTAQIITFLWRAHHSPEPSISNPFSDVPSGKYYYKSALWAYERGLVNGTEFNPDKPCTRGETVIYLWKLAGAPSGTDSLNWGIYFPNGFYSDVANLWETRKAEDGELFFATYWATCAEITTGTSPTTFSPDNGCTRAQIATFLYRATNAEQLTYVNKTVNGIMILSGTPGSLGAGSSNLFDGNDSTVWNVPIGEGVFVEWKMQSPVTVKSMDMVASNDNTNNPGRNPGEWRLLGSSEEDYRRGIWTVVLNPDPSANPFKEYEATAPQENKLEGGAWSDNHEFHTASFAVNGTPTAYQYYRLEIKSTTGHGYLRLSSVVFHY